MNPRILLSLLLLTGCGREEGEPTFTEAVATVYTPCEPTGIQAAAGLHAMQLAFSPCGSNNFIHHAWSPDGLSLYYQASQGAWLKRDNGENYPLRIGHPRANPAWLNPEMLAYADADGRKIGIYQVSAHVLNLVELDQVEPEQLQKGREHDEVLFMAADTPSGFKDVYRFSANTGESEKAFEWMDGGVETFTYEPRVDVVCFRELAGVDVVCRRGDGGEQLIKVKNRHRGTLSTDGRYLVTEGAGAPIPVYGDDEIGRRRAANAPDFMPQTITPPSFWIHDLETGEEVQWEGVHGTDFRWYEAAPYFASFMLWGFDRKELNRNVPLVDLRNFLKSKGWEVPLAAKKAEPPVHAQ